VEEANAVGTAWLRLDLLPAEDQPAVRAAMRSYVDARMRVHRALRDVGAALAAHREVAVLQQQVWSLARAAVERDGRPNVAVLVVPALNAMFDIGTSRVAALRAHLPTPILVLLFLAAILAAVLAASACGRPEDGIGCTSSSFAGVTALTAYVILDLEYPSVGLIRLDDADVRLIEVRDAMR